MDLPATDGEWHYVRIFFTQRVYDGSDRLWVNVGYLKIVHVLYDGALCALDYPVHDTSIIEILLEFQLASEK